MYLYIQKLYKLYNYTISKSSNQIFYVSSSRACCFLEHTHKPSKHFKIFLNKFNLLIEIRLRFFIFHIHLHCSIKNVIKMQAHAAHTKLEKTAVLFTLSCPR